MKNQFICFDTYESGITSVHIPDLPEVLQKGHHFFMEAKEFYREDDHIKETIDLYLERLNTYLSAPPIVNTLLSKVEAYFLQRFLAMHKTILSREELKQFIYDFQNAILKKEITKESIVAHHLGEIQDKIIQEHNKLPYDGKIEIVLNKKWRSALHAILDHKQKETLQGYNDVIPDSSVSIPKSKSASLFTPINKAHQRTIENTFRLNGTLGELLGDLEKFELAVTIEGDQGGGKTRFTYQLADAFADIGNRIAIFSLEIGSRSDLITRMKEQYLEPVNQDHIFITDQLPEGYTTISNVANDFDVIVIDSWNKTGLPSQDFDRLRKQHPETIFIVIFQRTTQKTIRGGTAPLFDAGINIEIVKADDTFKNNYAVTTKNRYGVTGIRYNISSKELIETTQLSPQL
ncbi:antirestriction protein [Aquimarina aquimarini]|uniref:antirestriction protein n=1 Tax=Aquimarina aquimarini TaxID=1191734 RepID=UPI000D54AF68|nr:antirestriction protein [Aquimarina aquimarini]